MTDIVMLLRENADLDAAEHVPHEVVQMQYEAANKIERLHDQVARLSLYKPARPPANVIAFGCSSFKDNDQ